MPSHKPASRPNLTSSIAPSSRQNCHDNPRLTAALVAAISLLAALLPTTVAAAQPSRIAPAIGPSDFNDEFVAGNVNRAVAADWLPDGRALVLEQTGRIVVMDPSNNSTTPWIQITNLDSDAENGSLDFVVDNNFGATNHIYVYYKAASDGRLRIGRFTFTGSSNDTNSESIVWSNPGPAHADFGGSNHIGGSLTIGPDAKLYLTIGDGFNAPNSQSLDSVFGKILRINKDGSVPTDNPFYDGDGPNIDETYALGVRNPWRANWDYQTGRLWVGDVGGNEATTAYEEVNLIEPGKNYGWPLCEGPLEGPKNGPDCPAGITGPVYSYAHNVDDGCCFNASITGGNIVRGTIAPLEGDYVFADYARGDISALDLNGGTSGSQVTLLRDTESFIPWVDQGPDGHLYYLVFSYQGSFGELRRLRFTGEISNQAPVIRSTLTTPSSGTAPLDVAFSADAFDPEGTPLRYEWEFGDGQSSTATAPRHTYTEPGSYQARLSVSDGQFTTTSTPITIQVGVAPKIKITVPDSAKNFSAGDTITLTAKATDRDGTIGAKNIDWTVVFDHDDHQHPFSTAMGTGTLNLEVPRTGHTFQGDTGFSITATATDADGLTASEVVSIRPDKIEVRVGANVDNATVVVDGITQTSPFVLDTVRGFEHSVTAPASIGATTFGGWSDGAPRDRTITARPADSYRALFNRSLDARTTNGLVTLYMFNEVNDRASKGQVRDSSGNGKRLNVKVAQPDRVSYDGHKLSIEKGTKAVSKSWSRKITQSISASDSFTLEAWIDPASLKPGSHQFLTVAQSKSTVTAALGMQVAKSGAVKFTGVISTNRNGPGGRLIKTDDLTVAADELNHVALTRNKAGTVLMYLNGKPVGKWGVAGDIQAGVFQNISIGSKVEGGGFFTGNLHLVAVYSKALKAEAIQANFAAGPDPERNEK